MVLVGEDEMLSGNLTVKNMSEGTQQKLNNTRFIDFIKIIKQ